jgi:hypothetical protein
LLPPRFEVLAFLRAVSRSAVAARPIASHGAYNLWYLLHLEWNPISQRVLGPLTIEMVSVVLFALLFFVVLAGIWRDGSLRSLWAGAAIVAIAFFNVGPLQYERYLTPAVALTLLAAVYDRRFWVYFIGVSAMLYLNFGTSIVGCHCYPPVVAGPRWVAHLLTLGVSPNKGATINMALLVLGLLFFVFPSVEAVGRAWLGDLLGARSAGARASLSTEPRPAEYLTHKAGR